MSDQIKHTPGPWDVNALAGAWRTEVFAGTHLVCEVIGGQEHLGQARDFVQDEANARLIAAAPEMLAELKHLYERHGYQSTADVIAKAEGR